MYIHFAFTNRIAHIQPFYISSYLFGESDAAQIPFFTCINLLSFVHIVKNVYMLVRVCA